MHSHLITVLPRYQSGCSQPAAGFIEQQWRSPVGFIDGNKLPTASHQSGARSWAAGTLGCLPMQG